MFEKDNLIIYGNNGVCRVQEVGTLANIPSADKSRLYYTLVPLYDNGVIYTPVDTTIFMRPVISAEEANRLIAMIPDIRTEAYHNDNLFQLKEHYQSAIETHDCADLIELAMSIYAKKKFIEQQKRKFGQVDETFMKRAEELLYGEFAVALGIEKDEVPAYIASRAGLTEEAEAEVEA